MGSHAAFPGRQLGSSGVGQVILFKEPVLNGRQRSSHQPLFGLDGSKCLPPLPIPQLSGEQKLLGKLQTGFVGFSTIWC